MWFFLTVVFAWFIVVSITGGYGKTRTFIGKDELIHHMFCDVETYNRLKR